MQQNLKHPLTEKLEILRHIHNMYQRKIINKRKDPIFHYIAYRRHHLEEEKLNTLLAFQ
jgi:hypothetical protein